MIREITGDGGPCPAFISTFQQIGFEIVSFNIVKAGIYHIFVETVGQNGAHIGIFRHAREFGGLSPTLACVFSHLNNAVVGANIKQVFPDA